MGVEHSNGPDFGTPIGMNDKGEAVYKIYDGTGAEHYINEMGERQEIIVEEPEVMPTDVPYGKLKVTVEYEGANPEEKVRQLFGGGSEVTMTPNISSVSQYPYAHDQLVDTLQAPATIGQGEGAIARAKYLIKQGFTVEQATQLAELNLSPAEIAERLYVMQVQAKANTTRSMALPEVGSPAPSSREHGSSLGRRLLKRYGAVAIAGSLFILPIMHSKDAGVEAAHDHRWNPVARYLDAVEIDFNDSYGFIWGDK